MSIQYKVLGEAMSLSAVVWSIVDKAPAVAAVFAIIYYVLAIQEKRISIKQLKKDQKSP